MKEKELDARRIILTASRLWREERFKIAFRTPCRILRCTDARSKDRRTPIAIVGLRDSILVQTDDATLLAHKSQSQKVRSEEHTSELQSLRHLVCRLLLEKKN